MFDRLTFPLGGYFGRGNSYVLYGLGLSSGRTWTLTLSIDPGNEKQVFSDNQEGDSVRLY